MISSCRQMDEHPPLLRSTPFKGGLSWVESCSRGCVSKANVAYEYCGDGDLNNQAGVALESLDGAFTGKPWDPDAQLYYFPYRYYSPKNARWLTRDPLGMVDGPNVYAYVRGNPVNLIDPLGDSSVSFKIKGGSVYIIISYEAGTIILIVIVVGGAGAFVYVLNRMMKNRNRPDPNDYSFLDDETKDIPSRWKMAPTPPGKDIPSTFPIGPPTTKPWLIVEIINKILDSILRRCR